MRSLLPHKSGDIYNGLCLTGKSFMQKKARIVEFICICGNISYSNFNNIKIGHTKSCGCILSALIEERSLIHGMSRRGKPHTIYSTWNNIKSRCSDVNNEKYSDYGGRGIFVCKEWLADFMSFYKWAINNGWEKGLSIERKDNNKGYSPENCIWADDVIQSRNKRNNVNIEAFGEVKCAADWSKDERCSVTDEAIKYRIIKLGWDAEKAISHHRRANQYS